MNRRKEQCKGLGLNYSISVDKESYENIKNIREYLLTFNDRHISIGEVACILISIAREIHYPRIAQFTEKKSAAGLTLDKVGLLLKQLEEIVLKEKEKANE